MKKILVGIQVVSSAILISVLFSVVQLPDIVIPFSAVLAFLLLPVTFDQGLRNLQQKSRKSGVLIIVVALASFAALTLLVSAIIGLSRLT